jgi:hypothetical protein
MGADAGFELVHASLKTFPEYAIKQAVVTDRSPDQIITNQPAKS